MRLKMVLQGAVKAFTTISFIWLYLFIALQANITEAKIGYFWHITDLHFDSSYTTKGDIQKSCWLINHHQNSASHPPGRFGDYLCDSPWSLIESATQAMKSRQGDNVEFVLWTGDVLSHASRRETEKTRFELLRNITDLLGRTFPSQFVFPVLGDTDWENFDFHRLGDLWRHWLPSEALATFERGGYYTIEQTKSRLRIIALNTNYMQHDGKHNVHTAAIKQRPVYSDNIEYNNYYYHQSQQHLGNVGSSSGYYHGNQNAGGQVSALSGDPHESQRQWEWLEDVLAKSSRNKETVYIVGHIPPGSDERQVPNRHTLFTEKNNARYLRLVRKYSSIIQGQFFGHLHSDSFRIIYNELGTPVSWMMIAPSVTPKKMNVGSNNPAMRLYKFETDTGQVLDYTQYYLDLGSANTLGEAVWAPEYNLTSHYYGLGEVTSVALHNLADRFTNPDDPLFTKYIRANSVRLPHQLCDSVCALHHYCAITRVDYNEIRQCLETAASALSSSHTIITETSSTFLQVLLPSIIILKYHRKSIQQHITSFINTLVKIILILFAHLLNFSIRKFHRKHKFYLVILKKNCINEKLCQISKNILIMNHFYSIKSYLNLKLNKLVRISKSQFYNLNILDRLNYFNLLNKVQNCLM